MISDIPAIKFLPDGELAGMQAKPGNANAADAGTPTNQ
jgi:hypothetical protein